MSKFTIMGKLALRSDGVAACSGYKFDRVPCVDTVRKGTESHFRLSTIESWKLPESQRLPGLQI